MANGWAPRDSDEMVIDIYQRLRILNRHRAPHAPANVPGAIDASGGFDVSPVTDYYIESDDPYPVPTAPGAGASPPAGTSGSPVTASSGAPYLGAIQGATRAEVVATLMVTSGGTNTIIKPDEWSVSDLYGTPGTDVVPDSSTIARLIVGTGGWFGISVSWTMDWASTQGDTALILDWSGADPGYRPTDQHRNTGGADRYTLNAGPIWLPSGAYIAPYGFWNSLDNATDAYGAVDIIRYG